MKRDHHTILLKIVLCFTSVLCFAPVSKAQRELQEELHHHYLGYGSLAIGLPNLGSKYHVAFICEGEPFRSRLSQEEILALEERIAKVTNEKDVIETFAAAYDYDAKKVGATAYALTKRYTDPDDLPTIPLDEAALRLKRLMSACRSFTPERQTTRPMRRFLDSLTPEQKRLISTEGIIAGSLSSEQQEMWRQKVYSLGLHNLRYLDLLSLRLNICLKKDSAFGRGVFQGVNCPIYSGNFRSDGGKDRVALSYRFVNAPGNDMSEVVVGTLDASGKVIPSSEDKSDPAALPDPFVAKQRRPMSSTLKDFVASLKNNLVLKEEAPKEILVDEAVANKPVYADGLNYSNLNDIAAALAAANDLSLVRSPSSGTMRLTAPTLATLTSPEEIPAAIRKMIPAAYQRALAQHATRNVAAVVIPDVPNRPEAATKMYEEVERQRARENAWRELYLRSTRRLRTLIEPKLAANNDMLPIPDSGEEPRSLIALSSWASTAPEFLKSLEPIPSYLTNFEAGRIIIKSGDAPNTYRFRFSIGEKGGEGSGIAGTTTNP